jgi:prevent-host-death family protein
MKTLEMKQATASLAEYARDVKSEPVIVTVAGKPVAALVAIENADAETVSLSTNLRFLALIERSRTRHSAEGGITSPEMRRRLGLRRTASTRTR